MFVTVDIVHLYTTTQTSALIRGRLAPNQVVPVRGRPVEQDGWIWHRVNLPGKMWIPEMRVDGSEQLLVWIGSGTKPVPQKLTQPQLATPTVAKSTAAVTVDEETRVRTIAFGITSRFEGGGYGSYQNYDDGIVSYGRFQFTVKGGLAQVLQQYIASNGSEKTLADYLPRVKAADESLRHDEQFKIILQRAASDPVMQAAQDEAAIQLYWQPLHERYLKPRGLQLPLTRALLFDIAINFGMGDRFVQLCEEQLGVAYQSKIGDNGLREEDLIRCVAERRKASHDKQAERDNLPGLKVRGDFWVDLIASENWQLTGEIRVKNTIIQGTQPATTTLNVAPTTTPIPAADQPEASLSAEAAPTASIEPAVKSGRSELTSAPVTFVKIRPTGNKKVRVRPEPDLAIKNHGVIEAGEIVEIAAQDQAKIGKNGAWVWIRTAQGLEGYSAAWLFALVEPDATVQSAVNAEPAAEVAPSDAGSPASAEPDSQAYEDYETISTPAPVDETPDPEAIPPAEPLPEPEPAIATPIATSTLSVDTTQPDTPLAPDTIAEPTPINEPPVTVLKIRPKGPQLPNIRAAPTTTADVVTVAQLDEVLEVIEPDARAKIGVNGEWIKVRTPRGTEGYTATWLYTISEV